MTYVESESASAESLEWEADPMRVPILVVEDSAEEVLVYEKFLKGSGFQVLRAMTTRRRPREIPVLVVSPVDDQGKGLSLGADGYAVKPVERRWLLGQLRVLTRKQPVRRMLVIDDDEISRFLVCGYLDDFSCVVTEARDGEEGLRRAAQDAPDAIFLDLLMPGMSGFEVLERLRAERATRHTPVIVVTSQEIDADERRRLSDLGATIVSQVERSRHDRRGDPRRVAGRRTHRVAGVVVGRRRRGE